MDHFFGKLVPKLFNNSTDFILAVIAVKKYVEFITGNAGAKCAFRCVSGKTKSGLTDVLIAVIMSVGVIRMLEIVKVKHKEGSVSEIFRMEEKGLIRRTADENDQRQKQVTATEKGRELNSLVQAAFQEAEAVMVKGLRLEETEALRLLLYRVIENLEEDRTTC